MNKQTVDIIGDFVDNISAEVVISEVIDNGNGSYTLITNCTWWVSICHTYEIDGFKYIVDSFSINQSITVKPVGHANIPIPTTLTLLPPNYIHGTLKMAGNEVDGETDKTKLCPFVYLFEIITDRKNTDEESMIDREVDLRLFFLNSVNTKDWLTNEHYEYFVNPMQQMVDLFIYNIKNSKLFTDEVRHECTPLINVSEQGTKEKSVFDCNLSGIELRIFAEIREDLSCTSKNKCKC